MEIIEGRPPNYEDIRRVFPMAERKGTIFAFQGAIYTLDPSGITIPLEKHESVHIARQGLELDGCIEWWEKYLKDPQFRYDEELLAHRAEYMAARETLVNRQQKRQALKYIAKRLSSPLYGKMVTQKQAEKEIKNDT